MNTYRITMLIAAIGAILLGGAASAAELPDPDQLPANPALPDALKMMDGTPVTTPQQWREQRRPELKRLFQHYMYGYIPAPPGIDAKVTQTDANVFGGKATLKEIEIRIRGLPDDAPRIHLALFIPNGKGPAPVFLALNKCGNHTVTHHPTVRISTSWQHEGCPKGEEARGKETDFWCVEYLIERGYGFATYHESDIDPDKHDFTDGIHPYYPELPGPAQSRWGTIAAWAWGLHRCVDYLVTDAAVDAKRICVTGHSRRGKTALFAGAMDERIALVVPHQSGTGGAALSRDNDQETVERINRVFPHWFNDMFTRFDNNEAKLPIDQHLLMALVAPRPLLETAGDKDRWANYEAAHRAILEADKVYKFLGSPGVVGNGIVRDDQPINRQTAGTLMQYRLDINHTLTRDFWRAILDFADVNLK